MAEIKLFDIDIQGVTLSIENLRATLKNVKKDFESAAIGSEAFGDAEKKVKTLEAEIKRLTDATKANTQALGGVNKSAKFVEGSYGKLKQQIKENKDQLDKVRIGGKLYNALLAEQNKLLNKEIEVRGKMPSLFKERIKDAINEADAVKDLNDQIKKYTAIVLQGGEGSQEAAEKLAELKSQLDDVRDATNQLKGSGVEQLNTSINNLTEGIANFDGGKMSLALKGIGNAMKAIPIFLIIEGIKMLVDNFGDIYKWFQSFSDEAKEVKKLEKALDDLNKQTALNNAKTQNAIDLAELEVELLKQKNASYSQIKQKEEEIYQNKVNLIKADALQLEASSKVELAKLREAAANDDLSISYLRVAQNITKFFGQQEAAAEIEKKIIAEKEKLNKDSYDKLAANEVAIVELQGKLEQLNKNKEIKNLTDAKDLAQKRIDISDMLAQARIDAIKKVRLKEDEQLKFDEMREIRDAKKKLIELGQVGKFEQLKMDIETKYANQRNEIDKQRFQEDLDKETEKNDKLLEERKAAREYDLNDAVANAKLKTEFESKTLTEYYENRRKILEAEFEKDKALNTYTYSELQLLEKQHQQEITKINYEEKQKRVEIRNAEIQIIKDSYLAIDNIIQLFASNQEEQAYAAKIGALINVAANTATAISNLIAISFSPTQADNLINPLAPYLKIAGGLAAITSNMVQAKQIINSFEEGGYTGEGNPHEVSTNLGSKSYTYHKDEYVIPSRVLNTPTGFALAQKAETMRLGISNPMPYIGGFYDGGFTGRSAGNEATNKMFNSAMMQQLAKSLPTPVVRVTDINKVQTSSANAIKVSSL